MHVKSAQDPDYLGYVSFEVPGGLFSFTPNGDQRILQDQVEEVVEQISAVRDHPSEWELPGL